MLLFCATTLKKASIAEIRTASMQKIAPLLLQITAFMHLLSACLKKRAVSLMKKAAAVEMFAALME
ncbi:hypothetical protein [Zoogloea oryzae]|uniref:hypothetical protein n=1 Tax=Zoogloea oryzae TaxID=310767 RepID=UPI0024E04C43|nr:hypothetical protein [Zoogloea oryzae]